MKFTLYIKIREAYEVYKPRKFWKEKKSKPQQQLLLQFTLMD